MEFIGSHFDSEWFLGYVYNYSKPYVSFNLHEWVKNWRMIWRFMEFIGSHFDSELSNNWKWIFSLLDSCCFKFEDSSLCLIVWFHVVVNSGSFSLPGPYWLWGFGFQNLCVAVVRVVWMILGYFLCDVAGFESFKLISPYLVYG